MKDYELFLIFGLVISATITMFGFSSEVLNVRRRLRPSASANVRQGSLGLADLSARGEGVVLSNPMKTRDQKREQIQADLEMLGIYSPFMIAIISSARWVMTALGMLSVPLSNASLGTPGLLLSVIFIVSGFMLPELLVRKLANERRERIRREYPNLVELLQLYISSGSSLRLAMEGAVLHGHKALPILSGELQKVIQDIKAGREQSEALSLLAFRTQSAELKSLASLLTSGETFGVGVSASLAVFAANQRQTRYLDAEGRAGRIPALITLPLLFCIMPAVIAVVILPTAISVIRSF